MKQVPMRDLNQDTAGVMARVERGEVVEVTRHGKVIARIVPHRSGELDDLIAAGRVAPATIHDPFVAPTGPTPDRRPAENLVRDLRDEERW